MTKIKKSFFTGFAVFLTVLVLPGCSTTHTTQFVQGPAAPILEKCNPPLPIELPHIEVSEELIGMNPNDYEILIVAFNSIRDWGQSCFNVNANNMEKIAEFIRLRKELENKTTSRAVDQDTVKSIASGLALGGLLTK